MTANQSDQCTFPVSPIASHSSDGRCAVKGPKDERSELALYSVSSVRDDLGRQSRNRVGDHSSQLLPIHVILRDSSWRSCTSRDDVLLWFCPPLVLETEGERDRWDAIIKVMFSEHSKCWIW